MRRKEASVGVNMYVLSKVEMKGQKTRFNYSKSYKCSETQPPVSVLLHSLTRSHFQENSEYDDPRHYNVGENNNFHKGLWFMAFRSRQTTAKTGL